MKNISNDILDVLRSDDITAFVLANIAFPTSAGGALLVTDAPYDIVIGSNTYTANNTLQAVSTPQINASLDRDRLDVVLIDNDNSIINRANTQSAGTTLSLSTAFLNSSGVLINEEFNIYSGFLSSVTQQEQNNNLITVLSFTSDISKIDRTNLRTTSESSQKDIHPTDTAFDYAHVSDEDVMLGWGRI